MALRQIVEDISSELELAPLLARIVTRACALIGADDGTIGLYDAGRDVIRTEAVYRMPARELGADRARAIPTRCPRAMPSTRRRWTAAGSAQAVEQTGERHRSPNWGAGSTCLPQMQNACHGPRLRPCRARRGLSTPVRRGRAPVPGRGRRVSHWGACDAGTSNFRSTRAPIRPERHSAAPELFGIGPQSFASGSGRRRPMRRPRPGSPPK